MGHRNVVPVDRVVNGCDPTGRQMGDDLVAVQVPVDPGLGAAALFEAEHLAVELAGGGQVVDRHRQVETRDRGVEDAHSAMLRTTAALAARDPPHTNRARSSRLSTLP